MIASMPENSAMPSVPTAKAKAGVARGELMRARPSRWRRRRNPWRRPVVASAMEQNPKVTRLQFDDEHLRDIDYPRRTLRLTRGIGSGLTHDADGRLWAVGDRGPNL